MRNVGKAGFGMVVRVLAAGVVLWVLRMATSLGFLDANGRLPVVLEDGRLPANVEYFFTTLMSVYVVGAMAAAAWLLRRTPASRATAAGLGVGVGLVAVFLVLDGGLEIFVAHRGWAHHFRNVVLDYGPLFLIPAGAGWLMSRRGD